MGLDADMGGDPPSNEPTLTFGQKAVGLNFNPSNDPHVQDLKEKAAAFIDACNAIREVAASGDVKRMMSLAITDAQSGQMWAVKAATWKD